MSVLEWLYNHVSVGTLILCAFCLFACLPYYLGWLTENDNYSNDFTIAGSVPNCVQINECASSPCLNGATCYDDSNAYTCICGAGFSGMLIQWVSLIWVQSVISPSLSWSFPQPFTFYCGPILLIILSSLILSNT